MPFSSRNSSVETVRRADQILVIDNGWILERGAHHELLRRGGLYAELCRTQLIDDDLESIAS